MYIWITNTYFWIEIHGENSALHRYVIGEGSILITFLLESLNFILLKHWVVPLKITGSLDFWGNVCQTYPCL